MALQQTNAATLAIVSAYSDLRLRRARVEASCIGEIERHGPGAKLAQLVMFLLAADPIGDQLTGQQGPSRMTSNRLGPQQHTGRAVRKKSNG